MVFYEELKESESVKKFMERFEDVRGEK